MKYRLLHVIDGRENHIDLLRFALATIVIFSHSYDLSAGAGFREPIRVATSHQRSGGELAVDAFFILSGLLITRSWRHSAGLLDFLHRRIRRIFPGFLVATAVSCLIVAPLLAPASFGYWGKFSWLTFLRDSLNLQGYLPADYPFTINGSLWSIRYEFFCYLAVAGLGMVGAIRSRGLVLMGWLACLGLYAAQIQWGLRMPGSRLTWLWCYPEWWPRLASDFFAGAVLFLYSDRIVMTDRRIAFAAAVLALGAFVVPGWQTLPLLVPTVGAYLLIGLAYRPGRLIRDFARRGDLSYGIYLYGFPCQVMVLAALPPSMNPWIVSLIALPASALLAYLSWKYVESPFLRRKREKSVLPVSGEPLVRPI